ncbi:D-alanyl-D-alanine carboxypeptidase [Candidatus Daviesbacteria bacterium]|nr:D-alanyl-D-alanine carboxypeptidase [Candidatus Daviesbacteria bacterium]
MNQMVADFIKHGIRRWQIFVISFLLVFLMVTLPKLGIGNQLKIVSPLPSRIDIFDQIRPKLETISASEFKLKKQSSGFVSETRAGAEYDQASAYAVVDLDSGEVIAEKNFSKKMPIASITKIMTAVVALDLAPLNQEFTVSARASGMVPTKIMLRPGERVNMELLLKSLLLSSANDSAEVIKEGIDQMYGDYIFIKAMNEKAKFLGLKNTHFTNPQGFDNKNHYSSVEDLAILANYALEKYPYISEVVAKEYEDFNTAYENRFYLNNWNGLLGVYPGVNGIKIGNTTDAGYTTTVVSQRAEKKLFAVLLGAPGVYERDLWTARLLDLGFERVAGLEPVNLTKLQLEAKYLTWKYSN